MFDVGVGVDVQCSSSPEPIEEHEKRQNYYVPLGQQFKQVHWLRLAT